MPTVATFLEQRRQEIPHDCSAVAALSWTQNRYATVLERFPWSFLIKEATFQTVTAITAGTVTVTNLSATVTETTSNANGWSSSVETRYFRRNGDNEFYLIDTFGNANPDTLTLNRVYEGATGSTIGYAIFQRFYSVASDCREILRVIDINAGHVLQEFSQTEMDESFANRPAEGNPPKAWAQAGRDSSNVTRIELYPIPDEAVGILYHYLQQTPTLSDHDSTILPQVDLRVMRAGWLADYWGWKAGQSNATGQELNLSQKYEQEFERRLVELMARECTNLPPSKIRFRSGAVRHRMSGKFSSPTGGVRMP